MGNVDLSKEQPEQPPQSIQEQRNPRLIVTVVLAVITLLVSVYHFAMTWKAVLLNGVDLLFESNLLQTTVNLVMAIVLLKTSLDLMNGTKKSAAVGHVLRVGMLGYYLTTACATIFSFHWFNLSALLVFVVFAAMLVLFYQFVNKRYDKHTVSIIAIIAILAVLILPRVFGLFGIIRFMGTAAVLKSLLNLLLSPQIWYWVTALLLILAVWNHTIPESDEEENRKNAKAFLHPLGYVALVIGLFVAIMTFIMVFDNSGGSSGSGRGPGSTCMVCGKPAVGPTYEFCAQHKQSLDSLWDYEYRTGQ